MSAELSSRDRRALAVLGVALVVTLLVKFWPAGSAGVVEAETNTTQAEMRLLQLRKMAGSAPARQEVRDRLSKELAGREWERMKANDSRECRNCHDFQAMDFTRQSKRGADAHSTQLATGINEGGKTCIDCHKGIAHRLPDMSAQ